MSESGDFNPGPWAGHDFASARRVYDAHVGRGYGGGTVDPDASGSEASVRRTATREEVLEASIATNATNPLVIWCDVTGSMGEWPAVIFSKLPYLEIEAKTYLGDDLEIAFGAVGDAFNDQLPLQMRKFASGLALKDRMLELVIEGKGGGGMQESYELAALYAAHHIEMPRAIKPVLIMIGDEMPYDSIAPDMAQTIAGVPLKGTLTTKKVFAELMRKFSVYVIRKPYHASSDNRMSAEDTEIRAAWVNLVGAGRVVDLPVPERVVDVIFGLLAKDTGRFDDFKREIEDRQRPEQVATVYKSLRTIGAFGDSSAGGDGRSILKLPEGGPGGRTQSLLEE